MAVSILALSSLACSISLGGPKIPTAEPTLPPVPTAIPQGQVQTSIPEGLKGAAFTLELTQDQLTNYLREQLNSQSDPVLKDPQVVLKDNQAEIYGYAQFGIFSGNVKVVATVSIDDQGQPKIKIISADLGSIPIPAPMLDVISSLLEDTLVANLESSTSGFRLEEIQITDGLMTVKGQLQ